MKYTGQVQVLLPTHELMAEFAQVEDLLKMVGTSTKEMVEMYLMAWNQFNFGYDLAPPYFEGDPTTTASVQAKLLAADVIFDAYERSRESENPIPTTDDRREIEKIMGLIWHNIVEYALAVLESVGVDDEHRNEMKFVRWMGDDLLVSIPTSRAR